MYDVLTLLSSIHVGEAELALRMSSFQRLVCLPSGIGCVLSGIITPITAPLSHNDDDIGS
jgi:hypothetical protein